MVTEIESTTYISNISSHDDEDGDSVDAIELTDGRVLAITGNAVVLYEDMEDFQGSLANSVERPRIEL